MHHVSQWSVVPAGDKSAGGVLLVDSFKFRDGGSLAWARVDLLHELNAFADCRRYFHSCYGGA